MSVRGPPCRLLACVLSHVRLFATPWTITLQAPLPIEFSRQEYLSALPFPSPGDLSDPGIKSMSLTSPALAGRFFTTSTTWEAHRLSEALLKKKKKKQSYSTFQKHVPSMGTVCKMNQNPRRSTKQGFCPPTFCYRPHTPSWQIDTRIWLFIYPTESGGVSATRTVQCLSGD